MSNGTRKGGNPEVMQTVFSSPGLEDLWQIHFSTLSGQEYTLMLAIRGRSAWISTGEFELAVP